MTDSDSAADADDHRDADLVEVGRIVRAHGVHGRVVVEAFTDQPRFEPGAVLVAGEDRKRMAIVSSRPYKGKLLVSFEGLTDRTAAEHLRHASLAICIDDVGDPPEGDVWIHDLVGRDAVDGSGRTVGTVVGVEDNPAHDLLVVEDHAGREILVPMISEFMDEIEPGADTVRLHPPPGLIPETGGAGAEADDP